MHACESRPLGFHSRIPSGSLLGSTKMRKIPDPCLRLGFGFVEVGTVTPRPQSGNPRPRIFRLPADEGLINRLGFNNEGFVAVRERLAARGSRSGILGINIGANRDSKDRIADYLAGIETFAANASYLTIMFRPRICLACANCRREACWTICWGARSRRATARRFDGRSC